ncbi:TolQ3 [Desulforapulum autotrophicum HRM2]|uniref:TolQ3 n=1 Tax=Desulforapulum autotrophicum (strain ATCC 43914 / DSM 3382 / VKM B-1955 / HRM2) TaxID=177437 RepID=C0QD92_DESAH|nr:MotA/TolQ/ExbB proton channel family protein [Desulforapulum autotrophicum]ACN13130.1 TolQ3 [Desulforapulum autotrophicum HRM2]
MILIILFLSMGITVHSFAAQQQTHDMRATAIEAQEQRNKMMHQADLERQTAAKEANESRQKIFQDKKSLTRAIEQQKQKNLALDQKNIQLKEKIKALKASKEKMGTRLAEMDAVVKELSGFVRITAKDIDTLIGQSLQSALIKDRKAAITPLLKTSKFPAMKDIRAMKNILMDEILGSGQVRIQQGTIIDQMGKEVMADILVLGNFTAAYRIDKTVGFLLFSDESQQLFALSKEPSSAMQKAIGKYMNGKSDAVPIDISKGNAMRQLTHRLSLLEQIPKGGPVVWPILALAVLAVLIILEKTFFLARKYLNAAPFMATLKKRIAAQDWEGCSQLLARHGKKPLARALSAGMDFRTKTRTDMENALQEAILREIPPLERFLSTLGMLAAIAPLMGLLGTVTGMINTFHTITFYGTSDPRMMSGGISEALVTTMLGLCVAIPIMLCHTLLSRWVETMIATMEEKGVAMVNAFFILGNGEF